MIRLRDISLRTKLFALVIGYTVLVGSVLLMAGHVMRVYRVHGPVYEQIAEDYRLINETEPPSMSLGAAWADGAEDVSLTLVVPGRPPTVAVGTADPRGVRTTFAVLADLTGTPDVPPVPPLPRGGRAVRLLCTPRADSPVAASWRAAGQVVAVVSADRPPVWYSPVVASG